VPKSFIVGEFGRFSGNGFCTNDSVAFVSLYLGAVESIQVRQWHTVDTQSPVLYAGFFFSLLGIWKMWLLFMQLGVRNQEKGMQSVVPLRLVAWLNSTLACFSA